MSLEVNIQLQNHQSSLQEMRTKIRYMDSVATPLVALDGISKIYLNFTKFIDFHGYYWDGNPTWKFPVDGFPSTDGKVAALNFKKSVVTNL